MRTLSASEFDKRFDDGEDGMEFLDLSKETIETEYDFSRAKRATEVSHLNKLREKSGKTRIKYGGLILENMAK